MHVGQLSHLASHVRECTFNPDNLPDFLRTDVEKYSLQNGHDTSHTGDFAFFHLCQTGDSFVHWRNVVVVVVVRSLFRFDR